MTYRIENNKLYSLNPKNEEVVGSLPVSNKQEVLDSVSKAIASGESWVKLEISERLAYLKKVIIELRELQPQWSKLITDEMGKPIKASESEVLWTLKEIESCVLPEAISALESTQLENSTHITEIHRVPVGVVAVIAPWNFPASTSLAGIIPALLAGNSVLYKASENTALSGNLMISAFQKILPTNVIQELVGDGSVGAELCNSNINMVCFTGSIETGKKIYKSQVDKINPVILELGGKDPLIVLDGADLSLASKHALRNSLFNAGQVCTSVERVFVEKSIYSEFLEKALLGFSKFTYGDPAEVQTKMGPMVSEKQRKIVVDQLLDAKNKGAKVVRGEVPEGKGYFIEPALVYDVTDKMILMNEETFGPVVAIQSVDSPEEALEKANKLEYGLGATVFASGVEKIKKYALEIQSGMVGINGRDSVGGSPFLGNKMSGLGFVEGAEGIQNFTQVRTLTYSKNK